MKSTHTLYLSEHITTHPLQILFVFTCTGSLDVKLAHLQLRHQFNLEIAELVQCPESWQDSDTAEWRLG